MNPMSSPLLSELRNAFRHESGVSRRLFLAHAGAIAAVPWLGSSARAENPVSFDKEPFSMGVASGDPDHRGMVLWTRLAPEPLAPNGGMPAVTVEVTYEVAEDEAFQKVVDRGTALATPQLGHSVHVEIHSLKPDRWYHYRFSAGGVRSPVGRTRTMPAPTDMPGQFRFAVTTCQNYEQGLFTGYEQMLRDEVDLVFHLGDYIYEYKSGQNGTIRTHLGQEIGTLEEYRIRHAQYRSDPLLQQMHAACPWFVTWDDHEFDNNYANHVSEEQGIDPVYFMWRRANAYQAYYEMMPLRRKCMPSGPDLQLYRKASFGRLAEFLILDARQYRSDQPNQDKRSPLNAEALEPRNTLLGHKQKHWLMQSLLGSGAVWNILAQQVMMGLVDRSTSEEASYSMDQWPGYAAERAALLQFIKERRISNPVVLTGDIHSNWANELRVDDTQPELERVATEFVCTSLSSGGNGTQKASDHDALMAKNPCIRFHNRERGYILCTATPSGLRSDYQVVEDVEKPGGKILTRASFVVPSGQAIIQPA
ncbi:alkaline phosphatase D family protein [bacterium]|nr:alkaline phosphatase D family protein [bacterium]